MKYATIEDLQRAEKEIAEIDRKIDQESNTEVIKAISEITGMSVGGGVGAGGGFAALYFAGVIGFSGPGIVSGLAAIGGVVGGGMLAGVGILIAAPVVLGIGGFLVTKYIRSQKFKKSREMLRTHAEARRDFLERLIRENENLGEKLSDYRKSLEQLTKMIDDLS